MSFTGVLGTIDSTPGNLEPGIIGGGGLEQNIPDTLTFSDLATGVNLHNPINDSLTFSESMTAYKIAVGSFSDNLVFTDNAWRNQVGSSNESVTFDDLMEKVNVWGRSIPDTLTLLESLTRIFNSVRSINEGLTLSEALSKNIIKLLQATDSLVLTENITGVAAKVTSDILTFSDSLTNFMVKTFHDLLDLSEELTLNKTIGKSGGSILELFEQLQVQIFVHKTITDNLVLSDTASGVAYKPINDNIVFSESILNTLSKILTDTLTFSESLTLNKVIGKSITETLTFTEVRRANFVLRQTLSDFLHFLEIVRNIKVQFASMTDTLTLTDMLAREIHTKTINDNLVFSDTMTGFKIDSESISESLILSENYNLNFVLRKPITDNLILGEACYAVVADRYMYLVGVSRSIALPPPEFNDFYADHNKTIIKRTMSGTVRTYNKTNNEEKLHYDFVLTRDQADDLREFFDEEHKNQIILTDWRGYRYKVRLLTDSLDFVETGRWAPCGNKVQVTLEFMGQKYAYN